MNQNHASQLVRLLVNYKETKGELDMAFSDVEYSFWVRTTSGISQKGQRDLISRLKRADRLAPLDKFTSAADHRKAIINSENWGLIPKKSQDSVLAASRRYFDWLEKQNS